jgi:hypothetical protein
MESAGNLRADLDWDVSSPSCAELQGEKKVVWHAGCTAAISMPNTSDPTTHSDTTLQKSALEDQKAAFPQLEAVARSSWPYQRYRNNTNHLAATVIFLLLQLGHTQPPFLKLSHAGRVESSSVASVSYKELV